MSAFMCETKHLSALAFYAVRNQLAGDVNSYSGEMKTEQDVFNILWHANRESLAARYPKSAAEMVGSAEPPAFDASVAVQCKFTAAHVIKSTKCFQYQACEYEGFETSEANKLAECIIQHAIRAIPGYEQAPWGAP